MVSIFILGFLLGIQHALEGDHLAAVAAISRNTSSRMKAIKQGCAWGLGHTLALLTLVLIVFVGEFSISDDQSHWMEFGVGIMLIALGIRAMQTARKQRVHSHFHRHDDGTLHIHAHRHAEGTATLHAHEHQKPTSKQALLPLLVGLVHGVAGSAALIVLLAATSLSNTWQALTYVAIFGCGSIIGMAAMSFAFTVPTNWIQAKAPWGGFAFSTTIGLGVIFIGIHRCVISAPI